MYGAREKSFALLLCRKERGYMQFKEEIMKSIEIMVNKAIEKHTPSFDVTAVVLDIKGDKYKVKIDGGEYWLKDGVNINPSVGMGVWVRIPNRRNMNGAYICAKR